jgi:hypothetical protein
MKIQKNKSPQPRRLIILLGVMILLGVLFMGSVSATTVTLNTPTNNFFNLGNSLTYNCSANITTIDVRNPVLQNISLFDNSTGMWKLNQTSKFNVFDEFSNIVVDGSKWVVTTSAGGANGAASVTENGTDQIIYASGTTAFQATGFGHAQSNSINLFADYYTYQIPFTAEVYNGYSGTNKYWVKLRTGANETVLAYESYVGEATINYRLILRLINSTTISYRIYGPLYQYGPVGWGNTVYIPGNSSTEIYFNTSSVTSNANLAYSKIFVKSVGSFANYDEVFPSTITSSTLWNCQACDNSTTANACSIDGNRTVNLDTILNSLSYNSTTYETATENFELNITPLGYIPTNAYLVYNGIVYAASITQSGSNYILNKGLTLSSSDIGVKTFYYNWTASSETQTSLNYTQIVSPLQFGLCNATLTVPYINFSFKDENNLSVVPGMISSSSFVYYLGDGTVNKTLTFANASANKNYAFCFSPPNRTIYSNLFMQYYGDAYPQRILNTAVSAHTNATTNTTLYMSTIGQYVTFVTAAVTNTPITGVDISITSVIEGVVTNIATGITDAAGSYTVWLNPNNEYTITATKVGYTTNTQTLRPSQPLYTLTMTSGVDSYTFVSSTAGIKWYVFPGVGTIKTNSSMMGFNSSAANFNLTRCRIELLSQNKTIIVAYAENTSRVNNSQCYVTMNYTKNALYPQMKGRLLIDLGDGYQILEEDAYWVFLTISSTGMTFTDWFNNIKSLDLSYFNNDAQHREYSQILIFFLVVMIICASLNLFGWDVQTQGGMIFLVGVFVIAASIPGFLNLNYISPFLWLDKYFVALVYTLFMIGFAAREML